MGLGRRTFAPGEVLTASNVMNYLQDQAVMNFAGTAARGSAIGTALAEGMVSYINDTDSLEVYRAIGTAAPGWQPVAFESRVGLIPMVPSSVVVGAGSQTTSANGLVTFTNVTSFSLNGVFTSQFDSYKIIFNLETTTTFPNGTLRLRAAGTDASGATDYSWYGPRTLSWAGISANGSGGASSWGMWDTNSGAGIWTFIADVVNPARAVRTSFISNYTTTHGTNLAQGTYAGRHNLTTAYDGFSFPLNTAVFNGTIQVFGYRN